MISRIMLSLRKAADPRQREWSVAEPTAYDRDIQSMRFLRPGGGTRDGRRDEYTDLEA
jgi:hypothetical protein